jgi:hypothetical protein
MTGPDDRPGWSITWLLRIQRRARTKPRPTRAGSDSGGTGFQWFSWGVVALLTIVVVLLAWIGIIPR